LIVAALVGSRGMSSELAPQSQPDTITINMRMAEGTNITVLHTYLAELDNLVRSSLPESDIEHYMREVRNGQGQIELSLVPQDERTIDAMALADTLRRQMENRVPGAEIRVRTQSGLQILNRI